MLRIQDIIGLILAILIVAILISIILILRESSRERKLWKEENEDFEEEPKIKKRLFIEKKINIKKSPPVIPSSQEGANKELEEKRKWLSIPRERENVAEESRMKKEAVPASEEKMTISEKVPISSFKISKETSGEPKIIPRIPLIEQKKTREPRQAILERGLKKLQEANIDMKNVKVVLTEDVVDFLPRLWDVMEKAQSGQPIGDIVVTIVFKGIPGMSSEEVIDQYRSGDVTVVDKLEARIRAEEGQDEFPVAALHVSHFQVLELDKLLKNGTLSPEEYELLKAVKFVDRTTKKDFARAVYARIMNEA
ncbi:MAG: hypothetical protein NTX88_01230 [Candidatus Atribacteria bacterium]|nr:hypothetical protein [Candidatus Atribacteria bacterium]